MSPLRSRLAWFVLATLGPLVLARPSPGEELAPRAIYQEVLHATALVLRPGPAGNNWQRSGTGWVIDQK